MSSRALMRLKAAAALVLWNVARGAFGHEPELSRYNYRSHVRPLFQTHCGGCHRKGGVGPMSLLDYQDAVPWARAIKLQVLDQRMPPFLPDDESGPFRNARALTAREVDILVDWAVGATPEGAAVEERENLPAVTGSEPSLLLEAPSDVVLEEDESEKTSCVGLPTELDRTRIATGFEIDSRQPRILRRATVYLGDSCAAAVPLATWLPDQGRVFLPDGLGQEIPASARLALELGYVKGWEEDGSRMVDRVKLGIWFSDAAAPLVPVRLEHASFFVEKPSLLVALYPALAGDSPLRVELVRKDGTSRLLLAIARFDPAWSEKYFFEAPVAIPAGSEIRVSRPVVWADFAPVGEK